MPGLLLLLILLAGFGVLLWYAVAAPSSQMLGKTMVQGKRESGTIALTFDDGPGEATPQILDMLGKAGVRATFFLCGGNVERFPQLARRIAEEGHEIGNHTYSHPRLLWRTPGKIAWEIERAQNVIAHHTGRQPALFRPPYGLRWFGLFPILSQRKMMAVMWSVNGYDWRLPAREIAGRVLRGAGSGSIILLHDGVPPHQSASRQPTVEALEQVVRELQGRYRFVTISEMQSERDTTLGML